MPPKRGVGRPRTVRATREARDDHVPPAVSQSSVSPIDQDALRQLVQDAARQVAQDAARQAAQEAVQQIAQETARQAAQTVAQEVAHQLAVAQQGQRGTHVQMQGGPQIYEQGGPQVQVQQDHQFPAQHAPIPQAPAQQFPQGIQFPPPPPPYPVYDDRFYRLTSQMKNMDMEHFAGAIDPTRAYDWKLSLERKLEIIDCPPEFSLRLAMQYLRGDALVWWDGVRRDYGHLIPTFEDFKREFDRKYFPKEAMDRKKCDFELVSQGSRTIREYEVEFGRLRRFAGGGYSEEDLIRKFLNGMRVEIRNRCRLVTYHRLGDLVEKAAEQEAGLAEEQKYSRSAQPRSSRTPDSLKRPWDHTGAAYCERCRRRHVGKCFQCFNCGKSGHVSRNCQERPSGDQRAPPPPPVARAGPAGAPFAPGACYTCGQFGHIARDCRTRGPPAKRPAIAPRVHALGGTDGAEPIAGDTDDQD